MVTSESVDKACLEVGEYTDEKMLDEFDRFFQSQPAICSFVVDATTESSQQIQELSLFLSYMVFKACELEDSTAVKSVTPEAIDSAYRTSESWIQQINQSRTDEIESVIASSLRLDNEPYLLQYVVSELNELLEDGSALNDDEKGEVFFVLKTVIMSLSA